MSYNGSGTFNINSTGQPVVAGTVITASAFNALTADLATGLTTAITKDGQTTTTARITFAQGVTSSLVTDSSSVSTGSIITAGGVGIAKALYVGTTANVAGAVTLGGIATFSAQPIFSSLTASSAVATDASKGLVSVTNTGTGNNVLATSPTLVTPALGTPSALVLTNATGLPAAQLTGTQTIPRVTLPTGSVLQVVNAVSTTTYTNTTQTPLATSLAASITPSSNTSKILVLLAPSMYIASTGSDVGCGFYIYRGATQVYADANVYDSFFCNVVSSNLRGRMNLQYLDSPASTSSLTYTFYFSAYNGSVSLSLGNSKAQITLMEISA